MKHIPIAAAVLFTLAGCSATPLAAPTSDPTSPEVSSPAQELNSHDAINVAIGDTIELGQLGTSDPAFGLTVLEIVTAVECTKEGALPPLNGQYIGLSIAVATSADYESISGDRPARFFGNDFYSATSPDSDLTQLFAGVDCIDGEFPLDIPAGATTTGVVIIDAPSDTASIVWNPTTFSIDAPSYEWPIR